MAPHRPTENSRARRSRGSAWRPLALAFGAVLCGLGTAWTYHYFILTVAGQTTDAAALSEAAMVLSNLRSHAVRTALDMLPNVTLAIGAVVVVLVAVFGKRWIPAIWAVAAAVAANVITQVLKNVVFDRPDLGVNSPLGNSLPSGHTTIAASAAAAVTLVVTPRWRPLAAGLGGTLAFVSGGATVVNLWHRPADVVAALLVVGGVSALGAIPVILHDGRDPRTALSGAARVLSHRTVWAGVTGALALAGAVGAVVIPVLPAGLLTATVVGTVDTRTFWAGIALTGAVAYGITWLGIQLLSRPER